MDTQQLYLEVCIPYTCCGQSYQALETYLGKITNKLIITYSAGNLVIPHLQSRKSNEIFVQSY